MTNFDSFRPHTAFTRVVASMLLVLVFYGTTIEAAHRHGQLSHSGQAESTTSLTNPADAKSTLGGTSSCGDCLICRLHQNFSATLIVFRDIAPATPSKAPFTASTTVTFLSKTNTPKTGRAPPTHSV